MQDDASDNYGFLPLMQSTGEYVKAKTSRFTPIRSLPDAHGKDVVIRCRIEHVRATGKCLPLHLMTVLYSIPPVQVTSSLSFSSVT